MKTLLTALVTIGAMAGGTAAAQAPCTEWNTPKFFETATAVDITRCLADLEAWRDKKNTAPPLHWAAVYSDSPEVIAALLDTGADLEVRANGATALHWAAVYSDSPAVITALLDAGADLEARDRDGATALHLAARNNCTPAVITAFLDAGADLEARDRDGATPLYSAAFCDTPAVMIALLDAGADPRAPNGFGSTPQDVVEAYADGRAADAGWRRVLRRLRSAQ